MGFVLRWDPQASGQGKIIRPVSHNGDGWMIGGMPQPRPLYRLPDLADAEQIFVVEGEKAAEAGRIWNLATTTSPHGSKSAAKADWSPLAGKRVVILPDNDAAGERYAADVAAQLSRQTPRPEVRVIRLAELWPHLPKAGDLADLVELKDDDEVADMGNVFKTKATSVFMENPDLPVEPPVEAYQTFPIDAMPEPAAAFVREGSEAIGCDPAYIALPLLTVLASAIGNTRRLRIKNGWEELPILWAAVVGESGTMKTPAFRLAQKPLREVQAEMFKRYGKDKAAFEAEKLKHDNTLRHWKRAPEGEPPESPAEPTPARCLVADTTIEALVPILKDNPRGVLLAVDELAGWFKSFDRYSGGSGGADVAYWLSLFNAEPLIIDRKTGMRVTHVEGTGVWVCGGVQPGVLKQALGVQNLENGLASRLLVAMPPRRPSGGQRQKSNPLRRHGPHC